MAQYWWQYSAMYPADSSSLYSYVVGTQQQVTDFQAPIPTTLPGADDTVSFGASALEDMIAHGETWGVLNDGGSLDSGDLTVGVADSVSISEVGQPLYRRPDGPLVIVYTPVPGPAKLTATTATDVYVGSLGVLDATNTYYLKVNGGTVEADDAFGVTMDYAYGPVQGRTGPVAVPDQGATGGGTVTAVNIINAVNSITPNGSSIYMLADSSGDAGTITATNVYSTGDIGMNNVIDGANQSLVVANYDTNDDTPAGLTNKLTIENGGSVKITNSIGLGRQSGDNSTITVEGDDSQFITSAPLEVGQAGDGDLSISDEAQAQANLMWIGETPATASNDTNLSDFGTGDVTVDGDDSILKVNSLVVGGLIPTSSSPKIESGDEIVWAYTGGVGTLTVSNGAKVQVDDSLTLQGDLIYDSDDDVIGGNGGIALDEGGSLTVGDDNTGVANEPAGGARAANGGAAPLVIKTRVTGHGPLETLVSGGNPTYPAVEDDGTIEAQNGTLLIKGNVTGTGSGTILIDANSAIELGGTFGTAAQRGYGSYIPSVTVNFQNIANGKLILDNISASGNGFNGWGKITGLVGGDQIVLNGVGPASNTAVVAATLGYEDPSSQQLYLQIQTSATPYNPVGGSVENIPIDISNYNNSDYFTVAKSANGKNTILTYHEGNPSDPDDNPVDLAVDGQDVAQTGQGVVIGVISDGLESQAMEDIVKDIAPNATVKYVNLSADKVSVGGVVDELVSQKCQIIVDDITGTLDFLDDAIGIPGAVLPATRNNKEIRAAFTNNNITLVTSAGNGPAGSLISSSSHQALSEEITVAAMNMLATPGMGAYLPPSIEAFSAGGQRSSGKPDITGPDATPTAFKPTTPPLLSNNRQVELGGLDPFFGTSAAAPAVAAVAGLMVQATNHQLSTEQIDAILDSPAAAISKINGVAISGASGAGLIDAEVAVAAAQDEVAKLKLAAPQAPAAAPNGPGPAVSFADLSTPPGGVVEAGSTVTLEVQLSEGVVVTGVPTLMLNNNAVATYDANASDLTSGDLIFDYTAGANDYTPDLAVTSVSSNGATVQDAGGGAADFSALFGALTGVTVDSPLHVISVASSRTGEVQAGQTIALTLGLNKGVTVNSAGGSPTLTLSNGATAAFDANASDPSAGDLVFDYAVGAADDSPSLSVAAVNLSTGTTIQDASGDNADLSLAAIKQNLGVQVGPAFVDDLFVLPGTLSLEANAVDSGKTAGLAVVMSQAVSVSGSGALPTLTLNDGAVATYDAAESNTSQGLLVFDYAVGAEQTPDLTVTASNLGGYAITDASGVDANFASLVGAATEVTVNSPLTVKSVATSQTGDAAKYTLTMSESFTVGIGDDSPSLSLSDGATATYDANASSPADDTLVFDATLGSNELAADVGITGIALDGSAIQDASGNNADFSAAFASGPTVDFGPGVTFSGTATFTLSGAVLDAAQVTSVEIFQNGKDLGAATVEADGSWSFSTALTAGTYGGFTALAKDANGATSSGSAAFSLTAGISGEPYVADEKQFDADDNVTGEVFFAADGSIYSAIVLVADFLSDQAGLDSLPGGFAIADSVDDVIAALAALDADSHITGIDLTDPGIPTLTLTAAEVADDAVALNEISNPLYEVLAGAAVTYYAGGNGFGGAPIALSASGDPVVLKTNSNLSLTGSDDALSAGANAAAALAGGGNRVFANSGDLLSLSGTGAAMDIVFGSGAQIDLSDAQTKIIGGDDVIVASGADDEVKLFSTAGQFDRVFGSNIIAYVIDAQAKFIGGDESIRCSGTDDQLRLFSTGGQFDKVFGFNLDVYLVNAQANIIDGDDVVHASGAGDVVKLFATIGQYDKVFGPDVSGYLINAQASFIQGGDTIRLLNGADDSLKILATGGVADTVYGSGSTISVIGSQATINGSDDVIKMFDNDAVTLNGGSDHFIYQTAIGDDAVSGFSASDTMQFSAQDFASWSALQGHISQAGANTLISLDANDAVTLNNVTAASLSAAQFKFV